MTSIAHTQKRNYFKTFITMPWVPKFPYKELMGVCLKQGVQPWLIDAFKTSARKNPASCFLFSFFLGPKN